MKGNIKFEIKLWRYEEAQCKVANPIKPVRVH